MDGATATAVMERARTAAVLIAGFVASVLFSVLAARVGGEGAAVWTANGFLAGAVVLLSGRWRMGVVAFCVLAQAIINFAVGDGIVRAICFPLANLVEAGVAGWLAISFCGARSRRLPLSRLVLILVGAVVPGVLIGAFAGAALNTLVSGHDLIAGWVSWTIPGALGMALVLPVLLLVARAGQFNAFQRSAGEALGLYGGLVGLAIVVFFQRELPLMVLIFPTLTLIAFRLGPAGTGLAGLLLAMVGVPLTVLGHGPIMVAMGLDLTTRVRLVQVVVLAAMFTSLATAGAVAEEARLRRLVVARDRTARSARIRARAAEARAVAAAEQAPTRSRRDLARLA